MSDPVVRDPRSVPDDDPPPPLGGWLLDRLAEDEARAELPDAASSRPALRRPPHLPNGVETVTDEPVIETGDLVRVEWGDRVFHAIATDVDIDAEGGTFRLIVDPDDEEESTP